MLVDSIYTSTSGLTLFDCTLNTLAVGIFTAVPFIVCLPDLRNGWKIINPYKSFAVYAATATEKKEWMAHIRTCVNELLAKRESSFYVLCASVYLHDAPLRLVCICLGGGRHCTCVQENVCAPKISLG